jgi:hypothetical protein
LGDFDKNSSGHPAWDRNSTKTNIDKLAFKIALGNIALSKLLHKFDKNIWANVVAEDVKHSALKNHVKFSYPRHFTTLVFRAG